MRTTRMLAFSLSVAALFLCAAFSPPVDDYEYAGHYMGQTWSGYREFITDQYEDTEDFYYRPVSYAMIYGEPTTDELLRLSDFDVYSASFYPSFHGYVVIRMMLDKTSNKGWAVFNRADNDWYSPIFELRAHSVYTLTRNETAMLIAFMDQSFKESLTEKLDRTGLDGMGITVRQVSDGKMASFSIWSPDERSNPAVCRLLKALLDNAHGDAAYLYEYLGMKKP